MAVATAAVHGGGGLGGGGEAGDSLVGNWVRLQGLHVCRLEPLLAPPACCCVPGALHQPTPTLPYVLVTAAAATH